MTALMYPPSKNGIQKTLGAQLLAGVTAAVTLNNVDGIQNKPGVIVIDRVDTNGVETTSKREYISYTGTSGSTLVTLVRNADGGGTDQDHAIGAVVEFIPDVMWAQSVNDALGNLVNTTTLALDTTKVVDLTTGQTLTNKTLTAPVINGATNAALTRPKITTSIDDANGNEVIKTPATASATNDITVTNAATLNNPVISASGTDDNVGLTLTPKGTGKVTVSANDFGIATGANIQVNGADPKRAFYVPASAMYGTITTGATLGQTETSTNKVNYKTLDFDTAQDEYACFSMPAPLNWDLGTVTVQFFWTAASGSGTVMWAVQGLSCSNDDAIEQAYGTSKPIEDTLITAGDVHTTAATDAMTFAGTPAANDILFFRIWRDVSEDSLGVDAKLIGVRIEYGVSKYSDIA